MMKARTLIMASIFTLASVTATALAEDSSFAVQSADTVKSVLERSAGQSVGLRLTGGEELKGKVGRVGDKVVQLTELSGREFFDAVVPLDAIQAVIVKARAK